MSRQPLRWTLHEDEQLLWQGRPAPRCYLFKSWLQVLLGTLLFFAAGFWSILAWQLRQDQGYGLWILSAPGLLVFVSFALGPGVLLVRRRRWEGIFYALTDHRLLVAPGPGRNLRGYPLSELRGFQRKYYGEKLASIRLIFSAHDPVVLECIEHPELIVELIDRKT
jgi:hypothetical protein